MGGKLLKFCFYSKKFILAWCLTVLLIAWLFNFSNFFQQGPATSMAQEQEFAPVDLVVDENFEYAPGDLEAPYVEFAPGGLRWDAPVINTQTQITAPQAQESTVIDTYPECAGGTGMVHTVDKMSDGSYRSKNDTHFQSGVCGDTSNQQQPQIQPAQPQTQEQQPQVTQQAAPTVVRTYSECVGGVGRVRDVDQMSDGTYRTYNEHTQSGVCGDDGRDRDGGSVARTYSECAGSPGMVRDVEQLSNGGYRTFNEHYQAGACGDQRQNPPLPAVSPTPTSYTNYRCEGTTQVYYRIYSDGRYEPTGQRNNSSFTCGYQASPSPTPTATPFSQFQGSTFNNFFQPNTTQQYPALSANCTGSPSQTSVNQSMTWRAMTNGGSGSFDYRWSGDQIDGQTGSTIFVTYQTSGNRTVQVVIRDTVTGNSVSAACSINIMNASQNPTPTPTPMTQVLTNQPNVQCPSGTIERSRNGSQLVCEKPSPTITTVIANNSAQCPAGTTEKSRNNNEIICERQNSVSVAVIAPSPSPAAVQCPSGTIERSRAATELICERQSVSTNSQVFNTSSGNSQTKESLTVLTQGDTSIKELPKTGLPLAAIGLASLMPIGLRVKKMLGIKEAEESANLIWTNRQLNK